MTRVQSLELRLIFEAQSLSKHTHTHRTEKKIPSGKDLRGLGNHVIAFAQPTICPATFRFVSLPFQKDLLFPISTHPQRHHTDHCRTVPHPQDPPPGLLNGSLGRRLGPSDIFVLENHIPRIPPGERAPRGAAEFGHRLGQRQMEPGRTRDQIGGAGHLETVARRKRGKGLSPVVVFWVPSHPVPAVFGCSGVFPLNQKLFTFSRGSGNSPVLRLFWGTRCLERPYT